MAARSERPLKIFHIASECAPFAKSGGLGDVVAALPAAQAALGADVTIFLPRYGWIAPEQNELTLQSEPLFFDLGKNPIGVGIYERQLAPNLRLLLVDHRDTFDRAGLYGATASEPYIDNAWRFSLFCRAALAFMERHGFYDVVHGHDWQAAPLFVYLAEHFRTLAEKVSPPPAAPKRVFTIHNLAYQGRFAPELLKHVDFPAHDFHLEGYEFHGDINFLKAGLFLADQVTTVSPRYAEEIKTPAFGEGLDGYILSRELHARPLVGILNGIDTTVWNPATDALLPARYSAESLHGKRTCKAALQTEVGLELRAEVPIIGAISRLALQKGFDLLLPVLEQLMGDLEFQFVLLGSGDPALQAAFVALATKFPTRIAVRIGYNEPLAHLIEAGADLFVMPSRFEPCGLNQMYSLQYGTLPVVRATGGLDDSVIDLASAPTLGTGFKFQDFLRPQLATALRRAINFAHGDEKPAAMVRGMRQDFSWRASANKYLALYRSLI